jgi:hypothetical protein
MHGPMERREKQFVPPPGGYSKAPGRRGRGAVRLCQSAGFQMTAKQCSILFVSGTASGRLG